MPLGTTGCLAGPSISAAGIQCLFQGNCSIWRGATSFAVVTPFCVCQKYWLYFGQLRALLFMNVSFLCAQNLPLRDNLFIFFQASMAQGNLEDTYYFDGVSQESLELLLSYCYRQVRRHYERWMPEPVQWPPGEALFSSGLAAPAFAVMSAQNEICGYFCGILQSQKKKKVTDEDKTFCR